MDLPPEQGSHLQHAGAEYASFVFLLGADGVQPLPHPLYVALARGEARCPELAGRSFRLADWYVRLDRGAPAELVREWYGWIRFGAEGDFDPVGYQSEPLDGNVDPTALPSEDELRSMRRAVFGRAERSPVSTPHTA